MHCFDKKDYTIGDLIREILRIDNEADAQEFYTDYCVHLAGQPATEGYTPQGVAKANIGWCFGEGMEAEKRAMWIKVCDASHPIFGTRIPTFGEALKAGRDFAQKV